MSLKLNAKIHFGKFLCKEYIAGHLEAKIIVVIIF